MCSVREKEMGSHREHRVHGGDNGKLMKKWKEDWKKWLMVNFEL